MQEEVKITKIQMPFWNMVWFIVKWTLASIVALVVLALLLLLVMALVSMIIGNGADISTTVEHYSSHFHSYHHQH